MKASHQQKLSIEALQTHRLSAVSLEIYKTIAFSFALILSSLLLHSAEAQTSPYDQQVDGADEELHFIVVDIHRPHMRQGKTLNAPRYIYLQASRDPSRAEARRLAKSEKRALKRQKRRRRQVPTTPNETRPWEGRLLKASRLGPPRDRSYSERFINTLRKYEADKIAERDARLAALSANGSPIALSAPAAPSNLLESTDDDDEINDKKESEICGHVREQCCLTKDTENKICDSGLMCVDDICTPPPEPCGGFEQSCCDEGLACRRPSLECVSEGYERRCLLPPLTPERLRTPIGILEIIEVQGRIIKAIVRYDALNPQRGDQPLNAIRRGDEAIWYQR